MCQQPTTALFFIQVGAGKNRAAEPQSKNSGGGLPSPRAPRMGAANFWTEPSAADVRVATTRRPKTALGRGARYALFSILRRFALGNSCLPDCAFQIALAPVRTPPDKPQRGALTKPRLKVRRICGPKAWVNRTATSTQALKGRHKLLSPTQTAAVNFLGAMYVPWRRGETCISPFQGSGENWGQRKRRALPWASLGRPVGAQPRARLSRHFGAQFNKTPTSA